MGDVALGGEAMVGGLRSNEPRWIKQLQWGRSRVCERGWRITVGGFVVTRVWLR